jgi:hypothetical protein
MNDEELEGDGHVLFEGPNVFILLYRMRRYIKTSQENRYGS